MSGIYLRHWITTYTPSGGGTWQLRCTCGWDRLIAGDEAVGETIGELLERLKYEHRTGAPATGKGTAL